MVVCRHVLVHSIHQVVDVDCCISWHLRLGDCLLSLWSILTRATAILISVKSLALTSLLDIHLVISGIFAMRSKIGIFCVMSLSYGILLILKTMPLAGRLPTLLPLNTSLHLRMLHSRVIFRRIWQALPPKLLLRAPFRTDLSSSFFLVIGAMVLNLLPFQLQELFILLVVNVDVDKS